MTATLPPDLAARLAAGALGPFGVEVEFSTPPAPAELAALGLEPRGRRARGWLAADRLRALAALPQVVGIVPVADLAPPPVPPAVAPRAKLSSDLALELESSERQTFDVVVTFRGPGPHAAVPGLHVQLDMASGRLDRAAIQTLAGRDDVARIELEPEERALR